MGSCWEISDVNQGRPLGWIYWGVAPNLVRTGGAKICEQGDNQKNKNKKKGLPQL